MRAHILFATFALVAVAACADSTDPGTAITHTTVQSSPPPPAGGGTTPATTGGSTGSSTTPVANTPLAGFTIVPGTAGDLCVGSGGTLGSTLILENCDGTSSQRFVFEGDSLKTLDGLCVSTADGNQTTFGESMVLSDCTGSPGNYWGLYKGMIYATPNPNWTAIAPLNDAVAANTLLVVSHYNAADAAQHWTLNVTVPTTGGRVTVSGFPIASVSSPTTCLATANGAMTAAPCTSADIQTWIWNPEGGLAWGADNTLCLDTNVANPNVMAGTQAVLKTCDNTATQWWLGDTDLVLDGVNLQADGTLQSTDYPWTWGRSDQ